MTVVAGNYDSNKIILTFIQFTDKEAKDFVNSMSRQQADPFSGDALNACKDDPKEICTQLGALYAIESLSLSKA